MGCLPHNEKAASIEYASRSNATIQRLRAAIGAAKKTSTPSTAVVASNNAGEQKHEEEILNFTLKVAGKPFRCSCGCNVFHKPEKENPEKYECIAVVNGMTPNNLRGMK